MTHAGTGAAVGPRTGFWLELACPRRVHGGLSQVRQLPVTVQKHESGEN